MLDLLVRFFIKWIHYRGDLQLHFCLSVESKMKELHSFMPVMFIKALTQDKNESRNLYECPVYKTRERGPTYIWTFNLRTKEKTSKWILAGAALLLQIWTEQYFNHTLRAPHSWKYICFYAQYSYLVKVYYPHVGAFI